MMQSLQSAYFYQVYRPSIGQVWSTSKWRTLMNLDGESKR